MKLTLNKAELIEKALEQIKTDIKSGDLTAIEELLNSVPDQKLQGFISEE